MDGHTQCHSNVAAAEINLCDVIDSFGDFVTKLIYSVYCYLI